MTIVCIAIELYLLVVLVRIIMSWFPPTPGTTYQTVYDVFYNLTEPVLAPIRAALPPFRMGVAALDLSPIVVFILGYILQRALC
ncbi:MAG TPA: YggT family protein [Acidimicrobiales bacterium]